MTDQILLSQLSPGLQRAVETELRKTAALMLATLHRSQIARLANVLHQHCELQDIEVSLGNAKFKEGDW